jgi:anti-sigma-K factor RskA
MTTIDCQRIAELVPGYALGTLDVEEQLLVEAHLAQCPACQSELEEYRSVVSRLAFAAELREPSPELRRRVLAGGVAPPIDLAEERQQRRGVWQRLVPLRGWAIAALLIGLLAWNATLQLQVARQQDRLGHQVEAIALLALDDQAGVQLEGTSAAPAARAQLVPDADRDGTTLVVRGLQDLPSGRVYQLWLIRPDGQRDSGGLFTVEHGMAVTYLRLPAPLDQYMAVGVTEEPAGGSPGPTGTKVLGGTL